MKDIYTELTPEDRINVLNRWLELLESKTIRKGKERLVKLDKEGRMCYCAMGVLGIALEEHGYLSVNATPKSIKPYFSDMNGTTMDIMLKDYILSKLGLNMKMPIHVLPLRTSLENEVCKLNDEKNYSHKKIAKYIRKVFAEHKTLEFSGEPEVVYE